MEKALSEIEPISERAEQKLIFNSLGVIGASFKTMPIELREKLAKRIGFEALAELTRVDRSLAASEMVILSTCNRIELYYYGEKDAIEKSLIKLFGEQNEISSKLYHLTGRDATKHLFNVAAGLDSLVIGELQILSQVKDAYKQSADQGFAGEVLSRLFGKAYDTSRRIRVQDPKSAQGLNNSVSRAVLDLISKGFGDKKPNVLLIGSGKMIRLAIGSVSKDNVGKVIVAARRKSVEGLTADHVIGLEEISTTIAESQIDVVITATTAPNYILRADHLKQIRRPLLILDISVPRNVEPEVAKLQNVSLLNLDDLKDKIESPIEDYMDSQIRDELLQGVDDFSLWFTDYEAIAPLLSSLRKRAEMIREEELSNAFSRMPNLTQHQKAVVKKMSERLIRRFLHDPTHRLKQISRTQGNKKARMYAELITELFFSESTRVDK